MKRNSSLRLHIPEARFRPGDVPNFSYLQLPNAGEAERPPIDAVASSTRGLAYRLVRVLDDGTARSGPGTRISTSTCCSWACGTCC